jgi:molybdate transport system regulatory protein
MPKTFDAVPVLQTRLRVVANGEIAMGPGKADLLEQIAKTGSIADAARNLDMSYMRAWTLVKTMNAMFRAPLVVANRGGRERGGAGLSDDGYTVLKLYREMQEACLRVTETNWADLQTRLASQSTRRRAGKKRMKK